MNTPLPYRHLSDLSERQLLQVIVDKLCCVAGKYILDIYGGAAAAYSLRSLSKDTTDVVRVRRSVDNAEADFTASDITDGTLLSWVGGQNLLPNSEQFDLWSKFDTAVVANQATSPDATLTADLIYPTVTGNDKRIRQSLSIASGTTYTSSVFLKANGLSWVRFYPAPFTAPAWFDVANGVIGTVSSGTTASIEDYGNGWYRCSVTRTATTTGTGQFYVNLVDGNNLGTVTANGTDGILFWGAQVVEGSEAKPYVKTEANPSGIGYVTTWYDQVGSNDATQGTAARQPKIVDAGVLVTNNSKPAINFVDSSGTGVGQSLIAPNYYSASTTDVWAFSIYKLNLSGYYPYIFSGLNTDRGFIALHNSTSRELRTATVRTGGLSVYNGNAVPLSQTILRTDKANRSTISTWKDGVISINEQADRNEDFVMPTSTIIGGIISSAAITNDTNLSELIFYTSDQSSNRTGIETNINNHYNIYP